MEKRTWHYIQNPKEYEITCDRCEGSNIEWSEYEKMIWCYDCKIDTGGIKGVFDGPVGIGAAGVSGMSFDKYDMVNKRVVRFKEKQWDDLR